MNVYQRCLDKGWIRSLQEMVLISEIEILLLEPYYDKHCFGDGWTTNKTKDCVKPLKRLEHSKTNSSIDKSRNLNDNLLRNCDFWHGAYAFCQDLAVV